MSPPETVYVTNMFAGSWNGYRQFRTKSIQHIVSNSYEGNSQSDKRAKEITPGCLENKYHQKGTALFFIPPTQSFIEKLELLIK